MKTSELTGAALDWAVAKCEPNMLDLYYSEDNEPLLLEEAPDYHQEWEPSTNWAQGGPIIERESIAVDYSDGTASDSGKPYWCASAYYSDSRPQAAETPLVAAMRCYVASKLGDDIDIPETLNEKV